MVTVTDRGGNSPAGEGGTTRSKVHNIRGIQGLATGVGVFVVGVVASIVGTAGVALWFDESATIAASARPLGKIFELTRSVDAVHAAYYIFMHFWIDVFGAGPLSVRMPSALAVGLVGFAVVRFGTTVVDQRFGATAGLMTVLLPRVVWAGSEARQFGLSALLAVLLVWAVWSAWDRRDWRSWAAVGIVVAVSGYVFLFSVLLLPALIIASFVLRRSPWTTTLSLGLGAAPVIALVLVAAPQTGQVSWIREPSKAQLLKDVLVTQWFEGQDKPLGWYPPPWAEPAAIVLLAFVAALGAVAFFGARRYVNEMRLVVVAVLWACVPTVLLVGISIVATPLYVPRYLTFTAPSIGLLAALGARQLYSRAVVHASALVLVGATLLVPQLYMKDFTPRGADFKKVAAAVGEARAFWSDRIVFKNDQARAIGAAYPEPFVGSSDVLLVEGPADSNTLFGRSAEVAILGRVGRERVIFVGDHQGLDGVAYRELVKSCVAQEYPRGYGRIVLFDCRTGR
ncbi:glycosyltransferase family 39 protein [Sinomonas sp. P10A9]|uniref:Glycosyltransferase family 39 protein n=1 Tax=Sinomonas puerhi TaxID=3238584 RepID=A0AB39KZY3_9MICC